MDKTNEHFKAVGFAAGLVRIKELHMGMIDDLKQEMKDAYEQHQQNEEPTSQS